jgi:hypothetical protein
MQNVPKEPSSEGRLSLLLWLPAPEASLMGVATRSSDNAAPPPLLGRFFEAILINPSPTSGDAAYVEVYELIDHGRTAQRCLVYTSDTRRCLRVMQVSVECALNI